VVSHDVWQTTAQRVYFFCFLLHHTLYVSALDQVQSISHAFLIQELVTFPQGDAVACICKQGMEAAVQRLRGPRFQVNCQFKISRHIIVLAIFVKHVDISLFEDQQIPSLAKACVEGDEALQCTLRLRNMRVHEEINTHITRKIHPYGQRYAAVARR
jgi:hypothetical protein